MKPRGVCQGCGRSKVLFGPPGRMLVVAHRATSPEDPRRLLSTHCSGAHAPPLDSVPPPRARPAVVLHYPDLDRREVPRQNETLRFGPFASFEEAGEWARANLRPRSFHLAVLWGPGEVGEALRQFRVFHPEPHFDAPRSLG